MKKILTLAFSLACISMLNAQVKPVVSSLVATKKLGNVSQSYVPIGELNGRVYAVKSMIQNFPGKQMMGDKIAFISYDLKGSDQKEHIIDYSSTGIKKLYFYQAAMSKGKIVYIGGYKDKSVKGLSNVAVIIDPKTFKVEKKVVLGSFSGSPYEMQYLATTSVMKVNKKSGLTSIAWLDKNSGSFTYHILTLGADFSEKHRKDIKLSGSSYNFDMTVSGEVTFALITDANSNCLVYSIEESAINEHKLAESVSGVLFGLDNSSSPTFYSDMPGANTYEYTYDSNSKTIKKSAQFPNGDKYWLMNAFQDGDNTILVYDQLDGKVPNVLTNAYAGVTPNSIRYFSTKITIIENGKSIAEKSVERKTISAYPSFFDYLDERTVESSSGYFAYEKDGKTILLFNENGISAQTGYFTPKSMLKYIAIDRGTIGDKTSIGNMMPNILNGLKLSSGGYVFDTFGKKPLHGIVFVK